MRKILFLMMVALVLAVAGFGVWRVLASAPPRRAAETYIRALAAGDVETALRSSSGSAAYTASRLKESEVTAKVEDISCSVAALGRGWVGLLATVEVSLKDGSVDVGWYGLDMAKTGRGWKVVSFRQIDPELSGTALFMSRADAEAARQIFEEYMGALAAGDWQGAAKRLTGTARRSQEAGAAVLGKGAVIGKMEGLQAEPVWGQEKEMEVKFGYTVDGRDVSVLATFYRTGQGWKITRVLQT